jgi:hypothetical protein
MLRPEDHLLFAPVISDTTTAPAPTGISKKVTQHSANSERHLLEASRKSQDSLSLLSISSSIKRQL